mmetsp:Transcript_32139/g.54932  ORF Transcript_32139/g.54932 Transcript_32139/m.54932 type:complete len:223 (+) Transcript_32139:277-945(+)
MTVDPAVGIGIPSQSSVGMGCVDLDEMRRVGMFSSTRTVDAETGRLTRSLRFETPPLPRGPRRRREYCSLTRISQIAFVTTSRERHRRKARAGFASCCRLVYARLHLGRLIASKSRSATTRNALKEEGASADEDQDGGQCHHAESSSLELKGSWRGYGLRLGHLLSLGLRLAKLGQIKARLWPGSRRIRVFICQQVHSRCSVPAWRHRQRRPEWWPSGERLK